MYETCSNSVDFDMNMTQDPVSEQKQVIVICGLAQWQCLIPKQNQDWTQDHVLEWRYHSDPVSK